MSKPQNNPPVVVVAFCIRYENILKTVFTHYTRKGYGVGKKHA